MKLRLRASTSTLITGSKKIISEAASVEPRVHLSNDIASSDKSGAGFRNFVNSFSKRRTSHLGIADKFSTNMTSGDMALLLARSGNQGVQVHKRSLNTISVAEDVSSESGDDFSELGQLYLEAEGEHTQMVTEKAKASQTSDPSRRSAPGFSLHGNDKSMKSSFTEKANHSPTFRFDVGTHNDAPGIRSCNEIIEDKISRSITIEKVPPSISLFQLRDAASVFGEISSASMKRGSDTYNSCHVEYKSIQSKRKAVATRGIIVESFHLRICSLLVPENLTIRINNISSDTAEVAIHSLCSSSDGFQGLSRRKDGSVDVLFHIKDRSTKPALLRKLNGVLLDNCKWSAEIISGDNTSNVQANPADNQPSTGEQFSAHLELLLKASHTKRLCVEDLMHLHEQVSHLRDSPAC